MKTLLFFALLLSLPLTSDASDRYRVTVRRYPVYSRVVAPVYVRPVYVAPFFETEPIPVQAETVVVPQPITSRPAVVVGNAPAVSVVTPWVTVQVPAATRYYSAAPLPVVRRYYVPVRRVYVRW